MIVHDDRDEGDIETCPSLDMQSIHAQAMPSYASRYRPYLSM